MGLQQAGQVALLRLAEVERLAALGAPEAGVPDQQAPRPRHPLGLFRRRPSWPLPSHSMPRSTGHRAALLRRCPTSSGLGPVEEMPELDAEGGVGAVGLEEGGEALRAAAALGVGGAPEGRHRREGRAEGSGEGVRATGMAQGLADASEQGGAARLVGGPGGRAVLVVEAAELVEQGPIGCWGGGVPGGCPTAGACCAGLGRLGAGSVRIAQANPA